LQWRVLAKLSRYSFGIFILHPLVGMMFFRMAPERWSETTAGAVLTICGAAVASVLTAAAAYHLFENPLHRRLVKSIDAGSPDTSAALPKSRQAACLSSDSQLSAPQTAAGKSCP